MIIPAKTSEGCELMMMDGQPTNELFDQMLGAEPEMGYKLEVQLVMQKGAIDGVEVCCHSSVSSLK